MHKMLAGRALPFVLSAAMLALVPAHPAAAQSSRPPAAKPDKPGGGKPCNPRKQSCPDTTPPTIAIAIPGNGSTVAGMVTVSGTAADAVGVTIVEVQVDDEGFQ